MNVEIRKLVSPEDKAKLYAKLFCEEHKNIDENFCKLVEEMFLDIYTTAQKDYQMGLTQLGPATSLEFTNIIREKESIINNYKNKISSVFEYLRLKLDSTSGEWKDQDSPEYQIKRIKELLK